MNNDFWRGKRVFLTGHSGFKGSWLALWLTDRGAEVHGYSLPPPTQPNIFSLCGLSQRVATSRIGDVRDANALFSALHMVQPEIVFHLAAQSLVRESYQSPLDTFSTNVMGTVHLLEAIRQIPGVKAVVNVTTDKCYENREWVWPYRENDAMGGFDPYSSSKACSELIAASYRRSFLNAKEIHLATARAGNVIGGGDWAKDRLIPDFLRAIDAGTMLTIRSPTATRPWQHVLEPLSGYLILAENLYGGGHHFAQAWNFGPDDAGSRQVQWVVEYLCRHEPGATWSHDESGNPHEARSLTLDSSKAKAVLLWRPRWTLEKALESTLEWHRAWKGGGDLVSLSLEQIHEYERTDVN